MASFVAAPSTLGCSSQFGSTAQLGGRQLRQHTAFGCVSPARTRRAVRTVAFTGNHKEITKNVTPKLLINGEFVDSVSGKTFPTKDPRTEEVIMEVAEAAAEDVDRAVKAAHKAFYEGPWPKMSAMERSKIMHKWADLIDQNLEELAQLETLDNGKPLTVARAADVPSTSNCIRYYAGWADKVTGKTIRTDGPYHAYTLHEPIGVVGAIIPWNFPLLMAAWKLGPALCLGNTVVLKAAEQTPLSALRLGELALEAGIPPGVLNIITGDGPGAGASVSSHPMVDKIAFTGSTEVGRLVMQSASKNIKPVTLELGGKSPLIIWKDVDINNAVQQAHSALFFNMGQCCAAGSRVFVHEAIYDEFVASAAQCAQNRVVGDPFDDKTEQGPQVDADQLQKIMSYIERGQSEGARMVTGGARIGDKGYYVQPTVFADVKDDMGIARDEIFGPVQSIIKYSSIDEVLRRANDSSYGLASGVYSNNIDVVNTLSRGLKAGTVWVNCYNVYDVGVPFGGYKESGIGRDKGEYALENYSQVKAVYQKMSNPIWL